MISEEFVEAYERDMPSWRLHGGQNAQDLRQSRDWSFRFGLMLHDYLSDAQDKVKFDEKEFKNYHDWYNDSVPHIRKLTSADDESSTLQAANEFNFHNLNFRMLPMWQPMTYGWDLYRYRREQIRFIDILQDQIAMMGVKEYLVREKNAGPKKEFAYFHSDNKERRKTTEGLINEHDAAVVLLEWVKKEPELTVVPGPVQFERDDKNSDTNADFIVVKEDGRALGVQVKSRVTYDDFKKYDSKRIVLIDAAIDFDNVISTRTSTQKTDRKDVSWAGIISAQRVLSIPGKGPRSKYHAWNGNTVSLNRYKFHAREAVGDLNPRLQVAAQRIGNRIMGAL